jgi:hypothetical protein
LVGKTQTSNKEAKDGFIGKSTQAYFDVYPPIAEAIENGEDVSITYIDYAYIDNRINYTNQIDQCSERVIKLENKIDDLSFRLHRSDSILARTAARLEIMTELNNEN